MSGEAQKITLTTQEGTKFQVSKLIANVSGLVRNVTQDMEDTEEIPLEQVNESTFKNVLEFLEHHQFQHSAEIRKPIPSSNIEDCVEDHWDAEYINKFDSDSLLALINAANYMDIKGLLDLCCAKIACNFKGKSIEELKQEYGIDSDFTPEEEEQLKIENPWALEGEGDRLAQAKKLAANP